MVSDDVVGAVAEEFDAAALDEFDGFLIHQVSATHLATTELKLRQLQVTLSR